MPVEMMCAATPVMTRENELCLLLARGQRSPEVHGRILELLARPLQWPLILERARSHQVYPLVYRSLRDLDFPGVPEPVQSDLKSAYLANAVRNQLFAEELARLLGLLGDAGIRVIPLKGVALAQSLYGDVGARVCSDIDILVPAEDAVRARRIVLTNGYASEFKEEFFASRQLRSTAECPLVRETEVLTCLVELHWTLLHSSSKNRQAMENLWAQCRAGEFFGVRAYNLTAEWQFLYLAFHAAYHKWSSLKWLADIHELCVSSSVDWDQVKEKAERFDLDTFAGPTLAACSSLFGTPIPAQIPCRPLAADIQLFPTSSDSWKIKLFYPRLLKRPSDKVRWFAQTLFVPALADQRFVILPASLNFLYYVLRPLRLTCKWSWHFLREGWGRSKK